MVELFENRYEKCGICTKELEFYDRIIKFPIFRKEPRKGFDYEEPILVDTDDIEYVHATCLLTGKPK